MGNSNGGKMLISPLHHFFESEVTDEAIVESNVYDVFEYIDQVGVDADKHSSDTLCSNRGTK